MNDKQSLQLDVSRWNLIKDDGGFLGLSLIATVLGSNLVKQSLSIPKNNFTPAQALAKLIVDWGQ